MTTLILKKLRPAGKEIYQVKTEPVSAAGEEETQYSPVSPSYDPDYLPDPCNDPYDPDYLPNMEEFLKYFPPHLRLPVYGNVPTFESKHPRIKKENQVESFCPPAPPNTFFYNHLHPRIKKEGKELVVDEYEALLRSQNIARFTPLTEKAEEKKLVRPGTFSEAEIEEKFREDKDRNTEDENKENIPPFSPATPENPPSPPGPPPSPVLEMLRRVPLPPLAPEDLVSAKQSEEDEYLEPNPNHFGIIEDDPEDSQLRSLESFMNGPLPNTDQTIPDSPDSPDEDEDEDEDDTPDDPAFLDEETIPYDPSFDEETRTYGDHLDFLSTDPRFTPAYNRPSLILGSRIPAFIDFLTETDPKITVQDAHVMIDDWNQLIVEFDHGLGEKNKDFNEQVVERWSHVFRLRDQQRALNAINNDNVKIKNENTEGQQKKCEIPEEKNEIPQEKEKKAEIPQEKDELPQAPPTIKTRDKKVPHTGLGETKRKPEQEIDDYYQEESKRPCKKTKPNESVDQMVIDSSLSTTELIKKLKVARREQPHERSYINHLLRDLDPLPGFTPEFITDVVNSMCSLIQTANKSEWDDPDHPICKCVNTYNLRRRSTPLHAAKCLVGLYDNFHRKLEHMMSLVPYLMTHEKKRGEYILEPASHPRWTETEQNNQSPQGTAEKKEKEDPIKENKDESVQNIELSQADMVEQWKQDDLILDGRIAAEKFKNAAIALAKVSYPMYKEGEIDQILLGEPKDILRHDCVNARFYEMVACHVFRGHCVAK